MSLKIKSMATSGLIVGGSVATYSYLTPSIRGEYMGNFCYNISSKDDIEAAEKDINDLGTTFDNAEPAQMYKAGAYILREMIERAYKKQQKENEEEIKKYAQQYGTYANRPSDAETDVFLPVKSRKLYQNNANAPSLDISYTLAAYNASMCNIPPSRIGFLGDLKSKIFDTNLYKDLYSYHSTLKHKTITKTIIKDGKKKKIEYKEYWTESELDPFNDTLLLATFFEKSPYYQLEKILYENEQDVNKIGLKKTEKQWEEKKGELEEEYKRQIRALSSSNTSLNNEKEIVEKRLEYLKKVYYASGFLNYIKRQPYFGSHKEYVYKDNVTGPSIDTSIFGIPIKKFYMTDGPMCKFVRNNYYDTITITPEADKNKKDFLTTLMEGVKAAYKANKERYSRTDLKRRYIGVEGSQMDINEDGSINEKVRKNQLQKDFKYTDHSIFNRTNIRKFMDWMADDNTNDIKIDKVNDNNDNASTGGIDSTYEEVKNKYPEAIKIHEDLVEFLHKKKKYAKELSSSSEQKRSQKLEFGKGKKFDEFNVTDNLLSLTDWIRYRTYDELYKRPKGEKGSSNSDDPNKERDVTTFKYLPMEEKLRIGKKNKMDYMKFKEKLQKDKENKDNPNHKASNRGNSKELISEANNYIGRHFSNDKYIQEVCKKLGINMPDTIVDQRNEGTKVDSIKDAKEGDIVFFGNRSGFISGSNKDYVISSKNGKVVKEKLPIEIDEIRRVVKDVKENEYVNRDNVVSVGGVLRLNTKNSTAGKKALTANDLNKALRGQCAGMGDVVLKYSVMYNQDPAFMVSIIIRETGGNPTPNHRNNPMSCLSKGRHTKFSTMEKGIEEGIKNISMNNAYTSCKTIEEFAGMYVSGNKNNKAAANEWLHGGGDVIGKTYKKITGNDISSISINNGSTDPSSSDGVTANKEQLKYDPDEDGRGLTMSANFPLAERYKNINGEDTMNLIEEDKRLREEEDRRLKEIEADKVMNPDIKKSNIERYKALIERMRKDRREEIKSKNDKNKEYDKKNGIKIDKKTGEKYVPSDKVFVPLTVEQKISMFQTYMFNTIEPSPLSKLSKDTNFDSADYDESKINRKKYVYAQELEDIVWGSYRQENFKLFNWFIPFINNRVDVKEEGLDLDLLNNVATGGELRGLTGASSGVGNGNIVQTAISHIGETGEPTFQWFGMRDNWCGMFVSRVLYECGIDQSLFKKSASSVASYEEAKKKGEFHPRGTYTPKGGDIVWWHFSNSGVNTGNATNHISIVEKVEGDILYTIDGNSGSSTFAGAASYYLGSHVARNKHKLSDPSIVGYRSIGSQGSSDSTESREIAGIMESNANLSSGNSSTGSSDNSSSSSSDLRKEQRGGLSVDRIRTAVSKEDFLDDIGASMYSISGYLDGSDDDKVYKYLRSRGYSETATSAIMGTMITLKTAEFEKKDKEMSIKFKVKNGNYTKEEQKIIDDKSKEIDKQIEKIKKEMDKNSKTGIDEKLSKQIEDLYKKKSDLYKDNKAHGIFNWKNLRWVDNSFGLYNFSERHGRKYDTIESQIAFMDWELTHWGAKNFMQSPRSDYDEKVTMGVIDLNKNLSEADKKKYNDRFKKHKKELDKAREKYAFGKENSLYREDPSFFDKVISHIPIVNSISELSKKEEIKNGTYKPSGRLIEKKHKKVHLSDKIPWNGTLEEFKIFDYEELDDCVSVFINCYVDPSGKQDSLVNRTIENARTIYKEYYKNRECNADGKHKDYIALRGKNHSVAKESYLLLKDDVKGGNSSSEGYSNIMQFSNAIVSGFSDSVTSFGPVTEHNVVAAHNMPLGTIISIPQLKGKLGGGTFNASNGKVYDLGEKNNGKFVVADNGGPYFDFDVHGLGNVKGNMDVKIEKWGDGPVTWSITYAYNDAIKRGNFHSNAWEQCFSKYGGFKTAKLTKFKNEDMQNPLLNK